MTPPIVVSAGLSCQTAHQLGRLDAAGAVRQVKGPFDWMIAPPARLAGWVSAGLPDFAPGAIVADGRPDGSIRPYWPEFGIWFWHGFLDGPKGARRVAIEATFERELSKLDHQRARLIALDPADALFVVSNAQTNLDGAVFSTGEGFADHGLMRLDAEGVLTLRDALSAWLGGRVRMAVVGRADRTADSLARVSREGMSVHMVGADASEWKGDDAAWDSVAESWTDIHFPFR